MKKFSQRLEEEIQEHKPVVMAFGRMNPPTIGHEKLINHAQKVAQDYNAPHHIIISHSVDAKKNPLNAERKMIHAKRFFPDANIESSDRQVPTFLQQAARLHAMGHNHLIMVAGSDRVQEYENTLNRYNGEGPGKLYNFKKIDVKSAGHRDPDADGTEGISASKMREYSRNNDFNNFKQGVPPHVSEKHARELFKDVRAGMGIHENTNRGLFKAIFVSGGPGSGKNIIIHEAISEQNAVEINSATALTILKDKHKLYEVTRDVRREAIRNRLPLIITGTTNEQNDILDIREELEELGYETMMVFVNTTNESSKKRNERHEKMMLESMRQQRWELTQEVSQKFNQEFGKYLELDNSIDLSAATEFEIAKKEEDISVIYEMTNWFFNMNVENDIAESWLLKHKKLNINKMFENYITKTTLGKRYEQYVTENKSNSKTIFAEGQKYPSGNKASGPTFTTKAPEKETRFQQDNDKQKNRGKKTPSIEAGKVLKGVGIGPEYDTRGQGTVYPMAGLSNVIFKEQRMNKYTDKRTENCKSFAKFRKESFDSPSVEMGVTGGNHGPSNKEPLETEADRAVTQTSNNRKTRIYKKGK